MQLLPSPAHGMEFLCAAGLVSSVFQTFGPSRARRGLFGACLYALQWVAYRDLSVALDPFLNSRRELLRDTGQVDGEARMQSHSIVRRFLLYSKIFYVLSR